MPLWIANVAEEAFLDLLTAVGYTLRLYTNDVTAGLTASQIEALTAAAFTEATFTGYTAKTLTGGSWTTTQADPSTATYAQQTFTRTSTGTAQTVYGYYVTRTSDGVLMWFERFTGPITTTTNGDAIVITPTLTLADDQEATVAARGIVGTPQILTSSSSSYAAVDSNTDMTLASVATDSTRLYKVCLMAAWNVNGPCVWHVFATIDGVDTFRIGMINSDGTIKDGVLSGAGLWQPTTGSHTVLITVNNFSGISTLFFYANTDTPRQLWVEDIGPR
jgi:hypothetical protein